MNLIQDLRDGQAGLTGALFSTYTFAPEYFEQMVRYHVADRGAGTTVVVFTDAETYQTTLEEEAVSIGNQYQLAPVTVPNRTYHPKLCYLAGEEYAVGYVGSVNLTQRGINSNRELLTKVRCTSGDVKALGDALASGGELDADEQATARKVSVLYGVHQFYAQLLEVSNGDRIGQVARSHVGDVLEAASWLAEIGSELSDYSQVNTTSSLVHNFETPLWPQVKAELDRREESFRQVDIAVPYYGQTLDVPERIMDVSDSVTLWLQRGSTSIDTDQLADLVDRPGLTLRVYDESRFVHGKWLRIETDTATYSLLGSQNASRSAMLESASRPKDGAGGTGNVEVSLLQRRGSTDAFDDIIGDTQFENIEEYTGELPSASFRDPGNPQAAPTDGTVLELDSVSFRPDLTESAGTLRIAARRRSILPADPDERCLEVAPDMSDEIVIPLRSIHAVESETAAHSVDDWRTAIYERPIHRSKWVDALSGSVTAQLRWSDERSAQRWVEYHAVEAGENARAAEDAGANAIITNLSRLLQGDQDEIEDALASLQSVVASLDALSGEPLYSVESGQLQTPLPTSEAPDSDDGSVTPTATHPSWSGSTNEEDAESLVESFLDGWAGEVSVHRDQLLQERDFTESMPPDPETVTNQNITVTQHLASRLGALNTVTPYLDALDTHLQRQSDVDVSLDAVVRDLPERYRSLYLERTTVGSGETFLDSQLWGFLDRAGRVATDEYCGTERFHMALHDSIGAAIVTAAVICESQLDCYDPLADESANWPLARQYLMTLPESAPPELDQPILEWGVAQVDAAMDPIEVTMTESGTKELWSLVADALQYESDLRSVVGRFYARVILLGTDTRGKWTDMEIPIEVLESMQMYADELGRSIPETTLSTWELSSTH
ncbi:hypothetical protein GRX01_07845 [Halobaculum sp. WSA2]|uniref:Uncharacterized protein n=1 Tax=Halobaculum saliterrae TaxID=2073113 RepID=A0A6B0SQM6_9EURY|nr:phospholipase D family protein [Halobaculum saliterrae]MXR41248.1 hypothetical protein [Halobaculum saliterrae]